LICHCEAEGRGNLYLYLREFMMKKYLVIFEKAKENYSAYSPDLPGCIATGKTRKETEKNIKEAINFHLDGLKKDGVPLPEPSSFTEYVEV
jgi:predicted RNase H-like HicB family nuclease